MTSLLSRERRRAVYQELVSAAGLHLPPRAGWLLLSVGEHPGMSRLELARLLHVPDANLEHRLGDLTSSGYLAPSAGDGSQPVTLTPAGRAAYQNLFQAREERIRRLCADWQPELHPLLRALLTSITHQLAASDEKPGADLEVA